MNDTIRIERYRCFLHLYHLYSIHMLAFRRGFTEQTLPFLQSFRQVSHQTSLCRHSALLVFIKVTVKAVLS